MFRDVGASRPCLSVYAIGEASRIDREIWLVTCEYHSASMLRTSPHVLHPARHRAVLVNETYKCTRIRFIQTEQSSLL